ncbi:WecB/TagA/CpsF family glycosyltransferase [Chitinimonas koreensis]|uniref:WecB/TagA/CpsF family glycosyltransferase n=1 Tax=Chitinimonas koreensis TaxID=356302 RepID=UPI0003F4E804|nr:WecB/TagA/CpsF family glycosyltransferase [Chitinimonas koreensis]QNM95047.1 WecB/TagA/CpsF family glycosyltransferase [Chitinimonas koreensis]
MKSWSATVDNMKAIGIVLVLLGHAPGLPAFFKYAVYGFHVPLFFLLAGFLLAPERLAQPPAAAARRLGRTLLLPYALFFALSWAWWLLTRDGSAHAARDAAQAWYAPLAGLALGYGEALTVNYALWFFPALFATALLHHLLRRRLDAGPACAAALALALAVVLLREPSWPRLPWGLDNALVALGFYAAGALLRQWSEQRPARLVEPPPPRWAWPAALALAGAVAALTALNGRVDLNYLVFGRWPALYLPTAFAGIGLVAAVARRLPDSALARRLARDSLVLFPLHVLAFSLFTGIGVKLFGLPHDFKSASPLFGLAYTVGAVLLLMPLAALLRRLWPAVFGRGPAGRGRARPQPAADGTLAIAGFAVASADTDQAIALLERRMAAGQPSCVFFANTNFIVKCQPLRAEMAAPGLLIFNDGIGIDLGALLLHGRRFAANLNGTDFLPAFFAATPRRVYLLGGRPGVARRAAAVIESRHGQRVVGVRDGYGGMADPVAVLADIARAKPDVLLVALGNPLQERWILDHRAQLAVPATFAVGALFDFLSGEARRAPAWMRAAHLEWSYRLLCEPRRLARRYTLEIAVFLYYCLRFKARPR